jgi:hypothetical protein
MARAGRPWLGAALSLGLAAGAALAGGNPGFAVIGPGGTEVARLDADAFCLHWAHSVTGGAVADCFEVRAGTLVLTRSYLHDFAAGLGHLPGRGTQRAAKGGGYWIEGIDEPVPGNTLVLRVGAPRVGHTLVAGDTTINLSARAAGQRVLLRPLTPATPIDMAAPG